MPNRNEPAHGGDPPASAWSFLRSRWRGEVPLGIVFWRDMICVGTALNVLSTMVALLLLAAEAGTPTVLTVHFAPVPWNLFLFLSVWRSASNTGGQQASLAKAMAAVWVLLVTTI
ncbi:MAG TPA: hypothetical protein VH858_18615 [Hyphomicrobiales bacterium]